MYGVQFFQCTSTNVLIFFQNTTEDGHQRRKSGAGNRRRATQQADFESSDTQARV